MSKSCVLVWLSLVSASACGSDGADGVNGVDGMNGADGPAGPLAEPPSLSSLSPAWGSGLTRVTINGASFAATPADNHVTFNGHPAMVISATPTTLVVEPNVAVSEATPSVVNVEVGNQVSNGLVFELVPSGTSRPSLHSFPTAPTAAVVLGGKLYVAAGEGRLRSSGLYVQDATGAVKRVFGAERIQIDIGNGAQAVYDGPVGLASDGTYLYYSTALGAAFRYDPATGTRLKLLAAPQASSGDNDFPRGGGIVVDGSVVLVHQPNLNRVAIADRTTNTLTILNVADQVTNIAGNAATLFLTNKVNNRIDKVVDPRVGQTLTTSWITGVNNPTAVVVRNTDLLIACDQGLYSAPVATGGTATSLNINGLGSTGLSLDNGDIYLAKPSRSIVQRVPNATTTATTIVAGLLQFSLGSALIGDTLYIETLASDGWILEVKPDGTTRVLAIGQAIDVVAGATGELIVSDCVAHTISSINLTTGAATVLLSASDGLACPTGLHRDANGTLYYADFSTRSWDREPPRAFTTQRSRTSPARIHTSSKALATRCTRRPSAAARRRSRRSARRVR